MTEPGPVRAAAWVAVLAVAAYATSLGNGFAGDDVPIVRENIVVTSGDVARAWTAPYWRPEESAPGAGLYRPVTVASFALEWRVSGGSPLAFHAVNVAAHAAVSLLVFLLALSLVGPLGGLVGGALFAVHPVHVEAVANVVGRAELYAALFYLLACLTYLVGRDGSTALRSARLAALPALYLLSLGSKEMGVTLPGALLLLEVLRKDAKPLLVRLRREVSVFLVLAATLVTYVAVRQDVLGSVRGESVTPELWGVGTAGRFWAALSLWPEYVRLLLFPLRLSSDYQPAALFVSTGPDAAALLGALLVMGLLVAAVCLHSSAPVVALGILWFALAILPVSQLLFPAGVILAERTLYLPSVGLALAAAGIVPLLARRGARVRRTVAALALALGAGLLVRTVERNPVWESNYALLEALARDQPASARVLRSRGAALARSGHVDEARFLYETALELTPWSFTLLGDAAAFFAQQGEIDRVEVLLQRAVTVVPERPDPYRMLANERLRHGRAREAHAVALEGLTAAGPDHHLWAAVSEAHVARGDLPAAIRAREAALAADPGSHVDWERLAVLLEASGRREEALEARARARDSASERRGGTAS